MSALVHHEDAFEGSFYRCGWDLADVYRDRMTLRELWVRTQALPHDAPLWAAQREAAEKAAAQRKSADLDDALNRYR